MKMDLGESRLFSEGDVELLNAGYDIASPSTDVLDDEDWDCMVEQICAIGMGLATV